ncbi:glycosyltransferase [Priestia megaterium]|uniref:glycosyltransferase n=1 Tax=Priestia megaterium TaxID=1404 RepID=UPI00203A8B9E|nr:glycosyltransferase [Priestia megaterium]MCM3308576.1 hypothetical protein [Priestia megaterium]
MEFKEGSLYFSGGDEIHTTSLFKEITNNFTIEFSVKPEATLSIPHKESANQILGIPGQRFIIGPAYGSDQGTAGMGVSVGKNGVIVYEHSENYLPPLLVYRASILNWVHISIVYKDRTPLLYINGQLVKTGLKSRKQYIHPSGILGGLEPYGYYVGYAKDIRIWDFAKSELEIKNDIGKELFGNEEGLFVHWKLTEGVDAIFANQANNFEDKMILMTNNYPEKTGIKGEGDRDLVFCTSICANYLSKAMVLAKSVKKYHPYAKFIICLVEEETPSVAKEFKYFDEIILAKNLGIPNFHSFIFKHNAIEASTAVKGNLFLSLLDRYKDYNKFIYVDPDIYVMDELTELYSLLDEHSIVLTPHLLTPENKDNMIAIKGNEIQILQKGLFNLGFLAISRNPNAEKFISWWTDRLMHFCHDDTPNGLFTDQKWVDLSPCFFDVFILKHPGYNFAPWNYSKRTLSVTEQGELLVNNQRLKFIHFSGIDSGANLYVTRLYIRDSSSPIYTLYNQYIRELKEMGEDALKTITWSYGYYLNKEKIARNAQLNYRNDKKLQFMHKNPFKYSNKNFE